jgi:hypothetical protein
MVCLQNQSVICIKLINIHVKKFYEVFFEYAGFEDTKSACCGLGSNGAMIGCISTELACNQASAHVWWDLLNPTEAVNSILAEAAWSNQPIPNLCRPFTIHELVKIKT